MLDLTYFPHFIRANYPNIAVSTEEAEELGIRFKSYILEKFEGKLDKLESIWKINPNDVINSISHPLKTNGYEPALVLHFSNFCKEMASKIADDASDISMR